MGQPIQQQFQPQNLESYQSVANLQTETKVRLNYIELLAIAIQWATRIQQLEEEAARNTQSDSTAADSMSHTVLLKFQAQDRVLAAHDIKLAEHSLQDRLQAHGRCLVVGD